MIVMFGKYRCLVLMESDKSLVFEGCGGSSCQHALASDARANILKLLQEDILQVVVLLRNLPRTNHLSDTLQTLETCQIPLEQGNDIFQTSQSCLNRKALRQTFS